MLVDVLRALQAAVGFDRVLVVSRDAVALDLAASLGAEPMQERGLRGYRSAAEQAATAARAGGATGLLVLPADLPLVKGADLEGLLLESRRASVTLVPSQDGRGTNALLTHPPGVVPYRFGRDSFQAHLRAAQAAGVETIVVTAENLALDLDEPDDLRSLLARPTESDGSSARGYLAEIRLAERLEAVPLSG